MLVVLYKTYFSCSHLHGPPTKPKGGLCLEHGFCGALMEVIYTTRGAYFVDRPMIDMTITLEQHFLEQFCFDCFWCVAGR